MYYTITKFSFDCAHRLNGYDGKCKFLHGHRYNCEVVLKAQDLTKEGAKEGMLIDFTELKKINKKMEQILDHKTLLYYNDDLVGVLDPTEVFVSEFRTTTENLVKFIYHKYEDLLLDYISSNSIIPFVSIDCVKLSETPNNVVMYTTT